jgi:hypothetical protein
MTWRKAAVIAVAVVVLVQVAVAVLWALGTFDLTHHSKQDGIGARLHAGPAP